MTHADTMPRWARWHKGLSNVVMYCRFGTALQLPHPTVGLVVQCVHLNNNNMQILALMYGVRSVGVPGIAAR